MMKAIDMHGHFGDWDRGADSLRDRLWSGSIEVVRSRERSTDRTDGRIRYIGSYSLRWGPCRWKR